MGRHLMTLTIDPTHNTGERDAKPIFAAANRADVRLRETRAG